MKRCAYKCVHDQIIQSVIHVEIMFKKNTSHDLRCIDAIYKSINNTPKFCKLKDRQWNKPSSQAFGPTPQQFQLPLIKTLLKFPLLRTKVWKYIQISSYKLWKITHTQNKKKEIGLWWLSTYPAGLASLGGRWGVKLCWPLVTTDSQLLLSVVAKAACNLKIWQLPQTLLQLKLFL